MKLWMIGREYPSEFNKMRGSFELEQAKMLSQVYDVIYPSVDLRSIRHWRKWGINSFANDKLKVYRYDFPVGKCPSPIFKNIEKKKVEKLFNRIISIEGIPEIIHIHYPAMAYYESFAKLRDRGVKIVATEHWTNVLCKDVTPDNMRSLKWFDDNADAFICVGEPLKQSVIELTGTSRQIDVVPNVVPPIFFNARCIKENEQKFIFVASGRLVPVKQFDMLIESFADTFRYDNNVRLDIIGGGNEYSALQRLIQNLGMQEQILLYGPKKREEVAQIIKNSNVLVCSSRLETFGVPVIEAMACGKPVVVTDALGFTEPLDDTNSIKVSMYSKEEMKKALQEIHDNYSKYNSEEITKNAYKLFSEDAVREKLIKIYKEVLN